MSRRQISHEESNQWLKANKVVLKAHVWNYSRIEFLKIRIMYAVCYPVINTCTYRQICIYTHIYVYGWPYIIERERENVRYAYTSITRLVTGLAP